MDLFKRIQDLSAIYDDDGPSAMVQESRPMFNNGGMLVQPSDDGSRPGYAKVKRTSTTKDINKLDIRRFEDLFMADKLYANIKDVHKWLRDTFLKLNIYARRDQT